ncbi:MAG: sporulation integral membrane protein YtvI [Clostridiales bacterium]|nr:sporulation integral membrane protein YtvI [Clostridiales bacterium]
MKEMKNGYRLALVGLCLAAGLLSLRFVIPLLLPFLVGFVVAWGAEPLVKLLSRDGRLPRTAASGIAIGGLYLMLLTLLYLLGRLILGELDNLARQLPTVVAGLDQAAGRVQRWLYGLIARAPEHLQPELHQSVEQLFSNGAKLAQGAATQVLGLASRILLQLPDTFIFLGTAVLASFLISARLPRLRPWLMKKLPEAWSRRVLPMLQNLRVNLGGWFRAQCRLMGLTFVMLTVGFFLLRVKGAVLLGALIALVDALPMLGTGTVLVPWGVLELLQGRTALGFGLIAMYVMTALTRSVLEPRMVGRQLGLNPLVTLGALYIGYRLWGILGMLLAPVLTVTVLEIWSMARPDSQKS